MSAPEEVTDKIVISIVGSLGDPQKGDAQVSIHTSVDRDGDPAELDALGDRLYATFERLAAKSEIKRIEGHIRACEKIIQDTYAGDKQRVADFNKKRGDLAKQAEEQELKSAAAVKAQQDAWISNNRHGGFVLDRKATGAYGASERKLSELRTALFNLDAEQSQAMGNIEKVVASQKDSIKWAEREHERLTAIISPPQAGRAKGAA